MSHCELQDEIVSNNRDVMSASPSEIPLSSMVQWHKKSTAMKLRHSQYDSGLSADVLHQRHVYSYYEYSPFDGTHCCSIPILRRL